VVDRSGALLGECPVTHTKQHVHGLDGNRVIAGFVAGTEDVEEDRLDLIRAGTEVALSARPVQPVKRGALRTVCVAICAHAVVAHIAVVDCSIDALRVDTRGANGRRRVHNALICVVRVADSHLAQATVVIGRGRNVARGTRGSRR